MVPEVVGFVLVGGLLAMAVWQWGYRQARKEAAEEAKDKEQEYQTRCALASLERMRQGDAQDRVDGLSQEYLHTVSELLLKEQ